MRVAQGLFMSHPAITDMTNEKKWQTMEASWDSLSHDGDEPAPPGWHADVLIGRRAPAAD